MHAAERKSNRATPPARYNCGTNLLRLGLNANSRFLRLLKHISCKSSIYNNQFCNRLPPFCPVFLHVEFNMNSSQITVDLTNVTDSFTVEAIISIGDRCVRRFQTIPVIVREIRCDAFYYTFGTPPGRLVDYIDNENALNTDILKATSYTGSPVDYLRFTDYPEQKLEKLYCTATASGAYPDPLYNLRYACEICRPPKEPEFELQPGTTDRYRVLNPQQWEVNGLRCTLENTTWSQLGASENTDNTEFACLTIEKI